MHGKGLKQTGGWNLALVKRIENFHWLLWWRNNTSALETMRLIL